MCWLKSDCGEQLHLVASLVHYTIQRQRGKLLMWIKQQIKHRKNTDDPSCPVCVFRLLSVKMKSPSLESEGFEEHERLLRLIFLKLKKLSSLFRCTTRPRRTWARPCFTPLRPTPPYQVSSASRRPKLTSEAEVWSGRRLSEVRTVVSADPRSDRRNLTVSGLDV